MSLKHWLLAMFDTFVEEAPGLVSMAIPIARQQFRRHLKTIAPSSPYLLLRRYREYSVRSVDSRTRSMPPDWQGHRHVQRVIVFHDANEAGPHVEWYIDVDGQSYNIGVKRLTSERYNKVKYNSQGKLTQESRDYLLNIVREEYDGGGRGSFVGQSTDHHPREAREEWAEWDPLHQGGYGAGRSRTVLDDSTIEVWKLGQTIEGRDWVIDKHRDFYIHKPFPGSRDTILKVGLKKQANPTFKDRLHLKPRIGGQDTLELFKEHVGPDGIVTIKHDGASFYFILDRQGLQAFSPRISKETGSRISYTHRIGDLRYKTSEQRVVGMGELQYVDKRTGHTLLAHEVGGILNTRGPIPNYVEPRLTIYRIDEFGRKDVSHEPYKENLDRIRSVTSVLDDTRIHAPHVLEFDELIHNSDHEGFVGIPDGHSIHQGYKYKSRVDENDWVVDEIELKPGEKGGIAGVVWFKNEAGKRFKIGASSMGDRETVSHIMEHPEQYEGRVAKVLGYKGHEGRAARFVDWHLDKGTS